MADYSGNILNNFGIILTNQDSDGNPSANFIFLNINLSETVYYLMRGIDSDCGSLTYRTWVVVNTPDLTGNQYSGIKCGVSSLTDITVAAKWSVINN